MKKSYILTLFLCGLAARVPASPVWAGVEGKPAPAVIIDPGHGGKDWGAVVKGKREKDICLAVARRLKARLEKDGAGPVRLTRDSDTFLPLDQRVEPGLEAEGTVFISLHANDVRDKRLKGIEVYAFGRSGQKWRPPRRKHKLAPMPAPPREQTRASSELALSIVKSLRSAGLRVDPPERGQYYVLKSPGLPSVLVEMGHLSNPKEAAALERPGYQERVAAAIARGLERFLDSR